MRDRGMKRVLYLLIKRRRHFSILHGQRCKQNQSLNFALFQGDRFFPLKKTKLGHYQKSNLTTERLLKRSSLDGTTSVSTRPWLRFEQRGIF